MSTALKLFGALLTLALAQGPGNGLSKTTYAASDATVLGGLNFLLKYFPTTVAEDGSSGNIGVCSAGSSGSKETWYTMEGRAQLAESTSIGKCSIFHTSQSTVPSGSVGMTPPASKGDDCSYDSSVENALGMTFPPAGEAHWTYAHTKQTCCKSCAADTDCKFAAYFAGSGLTSGRRLPPMQGEGFGLHLVSLPAHQTSGATGLGKSVEEIEGIFNDKLGDMSVFDAWMDYSVGLFTQDLDTYTKRFNADKIPFLSATWPAADETWYSVFVQVPKTQMVIELLASSSSLKPTLVLEPRMTSTRITQLKSSPPATGLLTAVSVSRLASDMDWVEDFYTNGVGATKTMSYSQANVTKSCFQWPGSAADVCFANRPDSATKGTFKAKDFEKMLFDVRENYEGVNPNCGMDRWEDNHYAMDLRSGDFSALASYITQHKSSTTKKVYYQCQSGPGKLTFPPRMGGTHYVSDPTGWFIQADLTMSNDPCSSSVVTSSPVGASVADSPFCSGGTCTKPATGIIV